MTGRSRRWVEVLGLAILSLLAAGLLAAGHNASRPWHTPAARVSTGAVAYGAAHQAAAPTSAPPSTTVAATTRTHPEATTTAPAATTSAPGATVPARSTLAMPTTTSTVNWVGRTVDLTYGGLSRDYLMFRPAAPSGSRLPVVVMLAGCCRSASAEAERANFRAVAGPSILVYPEYYQGDWNAGACCGPSATAGVDDVGFVTSVIDQVRAGQSDASQGPVYLAGYSNGGKLAMEMACREPSLFTAVAVYGATRTTDCTGPPPASVLVMVGTADDEVAIGPGPPVVQNGYTEPTVNQLITSYREADGCSNDRQTVTAGTALAGRWARCAAGRQVGEVLYEGLDHNWPEPSGSTPSGQQVIWDFFADMGA